MTSQKLASLGWEVLPHPPYRPDLAPTDFHLFRALQHHIENMQFDDDDQVKAELDTFFKEKPETFYAYGIECLQQTGQDVVEVVGEYLDD